jgi:hypothetical protein
LKALWEEILRRALVKVLLFGRTESRKGALYQVNNTRAKNIPAVQWSLFPGVKLALPELVASTSEVGEMDSPPDELPPPVSKSVEEVDRKTRGMNTK